MNKKTRKSKPAPPPPRKYAFALKSFLILLGLGGVAVIVAGVQSGFYWLRRTAAALPENQLEPGRLTITPQPKWIRRDLAHSVLDTLRAAVPATTLADPGLTEQVGRAFESSPWVARAGVQRSIQGLAVEIAYRRPVLCVPWRDEGCYVAADGVVLPVRNDAASEYLRNCLVAEGLEELVLPPLGKPFADERIAAAARFADFLDEQKDRLDLSAIIIKSKRGEPLECDLRTFRGSIVSWGMVGDLREPVDGQAKLDRLLANATSRYRLEGPNGPFHYDFSKGGSSLSRRALESPEGG